MAAFDPARILRASSVRFGSLRVRGVPAILLGVSSVIVAAGTVRALGKAAPMLPELIRETKLLVESSRNDRPRLKS
jgi:hypothetical protein